MSDMGVPRTYERVKIRFLQPGRAIFQGERWSGQDYILDNATETCILLSVEMELRGLKQGFEVMGRIAQKGYPIDGLEAKTKAALVAGIPHRVPLDFFVTTEITVKPDSPELTVWEADALLDDIHAPRLEEQAKAGNEAWKALETAIADIIDGLDNGYADNRDKIRDGLMFLERCNHSANSGMAYAWCEEKLPIIRSDMQKMAAYKSCNHPSAVKTAQHIQGLLRSWPIVNSWHKQPPQRLAKS